jgi:hypothetical protein
VREHQLPFQTRFKHVVIDVLNTIHAVDNDLDPVLVQILFVYLQWEAHIQPDTQTRVFFLLYDPQNCRLEIIAMASITKMGRTSLCKEPMLSVVEPIAGPEIHRSETPAIMNKRNVEIE